METTMLALTGFLTLAVIALFFAVFALARQIGVLHTRLAPAGALMTNAGPKLGQPVEPLALGAIDGSSVKIGGALGQPQLLLFVSPTCPICKELVPVAKSLARSEGLSLVFGSDGGSVESHQKYREKMGIEALPYVVSRELGLRFEVAKLPYAALIDADGVLRSKGLVNSREHLDSLVEAMRSGYTSIQDYLVKERIIGHDHSHDAGNLGESAV